MKYIWEIGSAPRLPISTSVLLSDDTVFALTVCVWTFIFFVFTAAGKKINTLDTAVFFPHFCVRGTSLL